MTKTPKLLTNFVLPHVIAHIITIKECFLCCQFLCRVSLLLVSGCWFLVAVVVVVVVVHRLGSLKLLLVHVFNEFQIVILFAQTTALICREAPAYQLGMIVSWDVSLTLRVYQGGRCCCCCSSFLLLLLRCDVFVS